MTENLPADAVRLFRRIDARLDALERRRIPDVPQLGPVTSSSPFTVVASDGSGDFTSINSAISALPVGATNFSHLIYVKTSSTPYDDSAGSIDLQGRDVTIWGQDAAYNGFYAIPDQPLGPQWKFKNIVNSGGEVGFRCINMHLVPTQSPFVVFGTTGVIDPTFDDCDIAGGVWSSSINCASAVFNDTRIGSAPFEAAATMPVNVTFSRCYLPAGLWGSGITMTFSGSPNSLRVESCRINMTTSATLAMGSLTLEQGNAIEFLNNRWEGSTSCTLSITACSKGDNIQFVGNTHPSTVGQTITFSVTCDFAAHVVFAGNNMKFCQVTLIDGTGTSGAACSIDGLYRSISVGIKGTIVNAMCDANRTTGITAITITADNALANVGIIPGTTTTGVNVSGNNCYINAPNKASCTTPLSNTGAGNTVN